MFALVVLKWHRDYLEGLPTLTGCYLLFTVSVFFSVTFW